MTTEKISIQLVSGEKDGWPDCIEVQAGTRPDTVFIWTNTDDDRMKRVKGDARAALAERLGTLAYRFTGAVPKEGAVGGIEYRYQRSPEDDKASTG